MWDHILEGCILETPFSYMGYSHCAIPYVESFLTVQGGERRAGVGSHDSHQTLPLVLTSTVTKQPRFPLCPC